MILWGWDLETEPGLHKAVSHPLTQQVHEAFVSTDAYYGFDSTSEPITDQSEAVQYRATRAAKATARKWRDLYIASQFSGVDINLKREMHHVFAYGSGYFDSLGEDQHLAFGTFVFDRQVDRIEVSQVQLELLKRSKNDLVREIALAGKLNQYIVEDLNMGFDRDVAIVYLQPYHRLPLRYQNSFTSIASAATQGILESAGFSYEEHKPAPSGRARKAVYSLA